MKPLPFQKDCLQQLRKFNSRGLLALDMGCGKTPTTLWHIIQERKTPAIVVCPASVKYQWRSLARHFGLTTAVLHTTRAVEVPKRDLIIINYDIIAYWIAQLRKLRPRILVLDEIQYVANWCKRTKACMSLAESVPAVLGLSGTPMLSKTTELFNGLHMIRPDVFDSRTIFNQLYAKWKLTPWGYKYAGPKNVDKLNDLLLQTCMIRKRKQDVLDQLPEKIRRVVPLEISDKHEYELATNEFVWWLEQQNEKNKTKQVANELAKVGHLLRLSARLKMDSVVAWLTDFLKFEEKVVVFANHKFVVADLLDRVKVPSVKVDGSVTGTRRVAAVEQFVRGKARMLVGNLRAAGVGIDGLQNATADVVFVELPWTPGLVVQAEDRAWRMGAKRNVWSWYLVAYNTIEEKLCNVLQSKQKHISTVLDGDEFENQLNILDQLKNYLGVK